MRLLPLLFVLAPAIAPSAAPSAPIVAGPQWPQRFFLGETHGEGVIKIVFSSPYAVHVKGVGHVAPDGTLVLEQRVQEDGKPARDRVWHLRGAVDGRYTGTLSDASSPVAAQADANSFRVRFKAKGGYSVDQKLILQPDGATVLNHMDIRKFGITVATLQETIRHVGG